jgi:hypothetical protein
MAELAEPFDVLLGEDLRRVVVAQAGDELQDAIEEAERRRTVEGEHNEQRPREPERVLVGAGATGLSEGRG